MRSPDQDVVSLGGDGPPYSIPARDLGEMRYMVPIVAPIVAPVEESPPLKVTNVLRIETIPMLCSTFWRGSVSDPQYIRHF